MEKNYGLKFNKKFAFLAIATVLLGLGVNAQCTPAMTVSPTSPSICSGKSVTLTASGVTSYTWTWTSGSSNNATISASVADNYTVMGTNGSGCVTTSVIPVTVLSLPSVSATASSPSVCSGNTVVLSGSGATGYTWNPNVGNNTTFTPAITTNYTVTGLGANGCTNTAVVNVLVINTPTQTPIATPTAICNGATSSLTSSGATSYSWSAINFIGSSNPTVAVTPTITTTYTLVRANGVCTSTALLNVVVNYPPTLFLTPAAGATVCACTGSAQLSVVGGITYTWVNSGATGAQLPVFPCVSTIYTVAAANSFCTTYSTIPVAVNPNPTITINASTLQVCFGGSVAISATGAPSFTWTRQTSPITNTILPNAPGFLDYPPYTSLYTATGSSTAGCVTSNQIVVTVNPVPTVNVVSSAPYACNGAATTLSVNPVTPGVTYSWSTNQTVPSIVVSPTINTNYTVKGTFNNTGCSTTTVFPLPVYIATFAVNTPSAICRGTTFTLTGSGGATSFTWGPPASQTGTAAIITPTVTSVISVTGATGQCKTIRTITINVNPLPPVSITTPKWVICLFDNADLTANGANSYTWTNADGTTDNSPTINFATSGNGGPNGMPTVSTTFTLSGIDNNGCVKTVTATVFVSNCTSIDELNGTVTKLDVYPNPNNGDFAIKSDTQLQLSIVNELGQSVKEVKLTDTMTEVNINGLPNGIYFIIGESNGVRIAKKLVVTK